MLSGAHALMLSTWKPQRLDWSHLKDQGIILSLEITGALAVSADLFYLFFEFGAHKCMGYKYFLSLLLGFHCVNENTVKCVLISYISS